jgi:hypothetical protein
MALTKMCVSLFVPDLRVLFVPDSPCLYALLQVEFFFDTIQAIKLVKTLNLFLTSFF